LPKQPVPKVLEELRGVLDPEGGASLEVAVESAEAALAPQILHGETPPSEIPGAPSPEPSAEEPAPQFGAFDTEQPEHVIQLEQLVAEQQAAEQRGVPAPLFEADGPHAVASTETDAEPNPFAPPARKSYGWLGTGAWSVALAGLIALLLAQYLYFSRNELARHAELRPMLSGFCSLLNNIVPCAIPLQRDIRRIEVENRTVQSHPAAPNALLVQLTLVNTARFAQPYPALELSFTDLNARLIAQRRFQAAEYLERGVNIGDGMTPGIPVQVTLELAAPDNGLNFELSSWNLALY
ncbi:MAG: DUF3426 domain-containing protein, partial [Gammaproteobacteria bacterium]